MHVIFFTESSKTCDQTFHDFFGGTGTRRRDFHRALSLSPSLSLSLERLFHILHGISSFSVVVVVVRSKKVNVCFLFITIIYVAITLYNLIIIIREI